MFSKCDALFSKCDALPKGAGSTREGDLFDMFVSGIYSRHSVWDFQASTLYQKPVPESDSSLHQFYNIMVASRPSLRCSYRKKPVSRRKAEGSVTELCSPRFVMYNSVQDLDYLQDIDCALSYDM